MKKILFAVLLTIGAPMLCHAQVNPIIYGSGAPSNPCFNGGQYYLDTTGHVWYSCLSNGSNWSNVGSTLPSNTGGAPSGPAGATFVAQAAPCGTATGCIRLTDDDSTDNCGTPLTNWMTAINAYAGPGEPQVFIMGSGPGKAFKLATTNCHLEFDIPTVVHLNATIDCAQTAANCIQFGQSGLAAQAYVSKSVLDGSGVLVGGASLTAAGIEMEPYDTNTEIHGISFHNFGATHTAGGSCTNWAVRFDPLVFEGTVAYTQWEYTDGAAGRCGYFNNGATGENTVFFIGNTMGGASDGGIPPTSCSNVGIYEGGYYGTVSYNNLYGFRVDARLAGVGTRVDHNTLDAAGCVNGSVRAPLQYGAPAGSTAVQGDTIDFNSMEGNSAHNTDLLAKAGDTSSSTIADFIIAGNVGNNNGGAFPHILDSSSCLISSVFNGTSCNMLGNQALVSPAAGNGWCVGTNCGQYFASAQAANITGATVSIVPYGTSYTVTCSVVLTQAASTSSTLPSCSIGWTDFTTSVSQSAQAFGTWAAGLNCSGSTTNTVGNSCEGIISAFAKGSTNFTVTTSGYASVGATPMQYQIQVEVYGKP